MSTIDSWLQNQPPVPEKIDGMQLYQKTVNNLTLKATAEGTGFGALFAGWGCWSFFFAGPQGVLGGLILLVVVWAGFAVPQAGLAWFSWSVVIVLGAIFIGVLVMSLSSSGTGQSRAVLKNPHRAAEVMREQVANLGARGPTNSERERITEQMLRVQAAGGGQLQPPDAWLVYDQPVHSSFTLGRTIFLTRELINSDFLGGLLAHELGRLQNGDGQIRLAIQQLLNHSDKENFPYQEEWVEYWRQQVFLADEFAAQYGFRLELIRYLERYLPLDVAKPYLWQEEPYKAERIDELQRPLYDQWEKSG